MISSQLTSHFLTGPCRFTPSATALKTSPLGLSPSNLGFPFNRVYGLNLFFISSHDVGGLRRSACISSPSACWDRMTHLNPQTQMQSYDIFPYWCLGVSVSPHRLCLGSSGSPRPDKHAFMTPFNARRLHVSAICTDRPPCRRILPWLYIFAPWHVYSWPSGATSPQLATAVLPSRNALKDNTMLFIT